MATKKQLPTETVGARIRALRLAANLTQDEFAAKLNVSRSAIAQWETDRAGQVRDNMERIAKVLNTSLGYLVSGETGSLMGDEPALMRLYRACASEDRRVLLLTARRLARPDGLPAAGAAITRALLPAPVRPSLSHLSLPRLIDWLDFLRLQHPQLPIDTASTGKMRVVERIIQQQAAQHIAAASPSFSRMNLPSLRASKSLPRLKLSRCSATVSGVYTIFHPACVSFRHKSTSLNATASSAASNPHRFKRPRAAPACTQPSPPPSALHNLRAHHVTWRIAGQPAKRMIRHPAHAQHHASVLHRAVRIQELCSPPRQFSPPFGIAFILYHAPQPCPLINEHVIIHKQQIVLVRYVCAPRLLIRE